MMAVTLASLVFGLAACGGDDGGEGGGNVPELNLDGASAEVKAAADAAAERDLNFVADHDQIVECAKKEGEVAIQTSSDEFDPFKEGFEKAYPDIEAEFIVLSGTATERFLLEAESGAARNYDVGYPAPEAYKEIAAMMGYDIEGMASAGILDIPAATIDEDLHTVVSPGSSGIALAYNRDLISEDELPTSWEELGEPRFSRDELGMSMDVDLNNVAVLSVDPEWGTDRVIALSEAMAKNEPIFADSHTSATLLVQSGEVAISPFVNLHSAYREVLNDPEGPLQVAFIEPVPVRQSEASGVMRDAEHPCSALLYIEWLASDPAQEILDADPLQASLSWDGSMMADMIGDSQTVIAEADQIAELSDAIASVQEAFGFPTAEVTEEE
jgi:ABC-type Fe3+ transport system substrate-binding protein